MRGNYFNLTAMGRCPTLMLKPLQGNNLLFILEPEFKIDEVNGSRAIA